MSLVFISKILYSLSMNNFPTAEERRESLEDTKFRNLLKEVNLLLDVQNPTYVLYGDLKNFSSRFTDLLIEKGYELDWLDTELKISY